MADFKPCLPYNVPAFLKKPTKKQVKGVTVKAYEGEPELIYISFRTFGGTEKQINGVHSVEDTAVIETWYRPDLTADCVIEVGGCPYEVMGTPENVRKQNKYLVIKAKAQKGGA